MIALPDTQFYAMTYPTPGLVQTLWIANQESNLNIQAAMHLGDIVNNEESAAQWDNAALFMSYMPAVPNLICAGNHDYVGVDPTGRDLAEFNAHFPSTRYTGADWFDGDLETAGASENVYTTFAVGDQTYLLMALEYAPRAAVVSWADGVLTANPDALAIVATHSYLNVDNTYTTEGQALWDGLIKLHDNIIVVLAGHMSTDEDGAGYRVDDSMGGQPVHQIQADYQKDEYGGGGYLRVMRFVPSARTIYIETFSPWLNQWMTDAENEFSVVY